MRDHFVFVLFTCVQLTGKSITVLCHDLRTECTFEEPTICGWKQDQKKDDMNWIRHQGLPQTIGTGPETDHTYQNISDEGYYMYIDASEKKQGHEARLISPNFLPSKTEVCFDFWYHMLSPNKVKKRGSLEVFISQNGRMIKDNPVFTVKGNQGNQWHHGSVVIGKIISYFNIIFIATRGSHFKGDIAIDDVRLYNCSNGNILETTTTQLETTYKSISTDSFDNPVSDSFTKQTRNFDNGTTSGNREPRLAEDKAGSLSSDKLVFWQVACLAFGILFVTAIVGLLLLFKRHKTNMTNTSV